MPGNALLGVLPLLLIFLLPVASLYLATLTGIRWLSAAWAYLVSLRRRAYGAAPFAKI